MKRAKLPVVNSELTITIEMPASVLTTLWRAASKPTLVSRKDSDMQIILQPPPVTELLSLCAHDRELLALRRRDLAVDEAQSGCVDWRRA
jgi:hypothetical protein